MHACIVDGLPSLFYASVFDCFVIDDAFGNGHASLLRWRRTAYEADVFLQQILKLPHTLFGVRFTGQTVTFCIKVGQYITCSIIKSREKSQKRYVTHLLKHTECVVLVDLQTLKFSSQILYFTIEISDVLFEIVAAC